MAIMKPAVNNNGTSRQSLVEIRVNAMKAVMGAMEALQLTKPHGRDYQSLPNSLERYEADRAIFVERFSTLDKLHNELQEEALTIHNGE